MKFLGDRLKPGQGLRPNEGLKSKNGRVKVVLQTDGNCVLYGDGRPLWWTGVRPGVNVALMQTDGNFVLYIGKQAVWASDTSGNPGAFLLAQDDGNLVLYAGSRALWNSQTNGFRYYGGPKGAVFSQIIEAAGDVVSAVEKIPIAGDIVHITGEIATAPVRVASAVASGERLDHVALNALTEQIKIVKDVAPYAQTVVSFVPGIGTGVSMAMGAGIALAQGQSITDAAKAAIRGALPGGALVTAGFDLALKVASGENVGKAALEAARSQLPANAQKAFDIGLAVATGEKIQTALAKGLASFAPGQLQTVLAAGERALASTPGLANAIKSLPIGEATQGFSLAAGLLSHAGINETALTAIRSQLPPAVVQGFDAALRTQEGHLAWLKNVTSAPVPAAAASPTAAALQQLAKLTPEQRQQLVAMTSAQQKQLVTSKATPPPTTTKAPPQIRERPTPAPSKVAARAPSPTKRPEPMPAAPSTTTAVATRYAPYPQGMLSGALDAAPAGYAPYPHSGALNAPPHGGHHGGGGHGGGHGGHGHGHGGHGGHDGRFARPIFRGGRRVPGWWGSWWDTPWSPEVVTTAVTCNTWGDTVELPPAMEKAARMALGASQGRPTSVRGPDNVLYLFAFESGALTARPCAAVATG